MHKDQLSGVLKTLLTTITLLLLVNLVPSINFRNGLTASQTELDSVSAPDKQDTIVRLEQKDSTSVSGTEKGWEIKDFSAQGNSLLPFFQSLAKSKEGQRSVRIGVLGDSFIEADIMTSKLRELLQQEYGGRGIGFVPVASPAAGYRRTVHHTYSDWETHSMIDCPNADRKRFSLSGYYFIPSEGASFRLRTVKGGSVAHAAFYFINQQQTAIDVSINGNDPTTYQPTAADSLQQLSFSDKTIRSIEVTVRNVDGFIGFGTYLNQSSGVYVDNYSVRGSSGSLLTTMNKRLTDQFKKEVNYDLLIVQYGLNVLPGGGYPAYGKGMQKAIRHLQKCYPNVPLILVSVGDKGAKGEDGITTDPGVVPLINVQREIAKQSGICFWNMYQAMGGKHSIVDFVNHKPAFAAKDYTHMTFAGGDFIGERLYNALMMEQKRISSQQIQTK